MKSMVPGGVVRALVALGLVSYHAVPALAVGKVAAPAPQLQWVTQLIVNGVAPVTQDTRTPLG